MKKENDKRQTVMVVDDTPANLKLLNEVLQAQKYRVLTIPLGTLALKAAKKDPPDIILLDINMPEMNGYEVCKQLKKDKDLKNIPVLFLSAYTETKDKIRAFEAGGVDYVSKPFQEQEILARIRTHLKIHQQQLEIEKKNGELNKLIGLRDNLTQMIVHDLRSPLTAINSALEIIQMLNDGKEDDDTIKLLDIATNSSKRMIELVSSLLDLNQLEAGGMQLKIEKVDVNILLEEAMNLTFDKDKNISFEIDVPGKPYFIVMDQELIRRVLINLLSNAIKFSPRDSKIRIKIADEENKVAFCVRDQGPGIPEKYCDMVFEKYGQVEVRKSGYSSGIGLAFSKLAIEAHEGEINVKSKEGEGCAFTFYLPKSLMKEEMSVAEKIK